MLGNQTRIANYVYEYKLVGHPNWMRIISPSPRLSDAAYAATLAFTKDRLIDIRQVIK